MTLSTLQTLAENFLQIAEELNEKVSNYFDGSNAEEDIEAYYTVKDADKAFTSAYNAYYGEHNDACLNYELAESVIA